MRERGEDEHYRTFRRMTDVYFAEFESGNVEAIAAMIDFYGGPGTFASWSPRARAYCISGAASATVAGASHFLIATHAKEVADLIARHVHQAGSGASL